MASEEKPLVSIIVPIYNSEKYLGRCINSITAQTYRNLEIILVNDGSKDDSLKICENYRKLDKRIKILDIENGGVSTARNCGIDVATGKYLQFTDSDDVIDEYMIENMVNLMELYNADITFCGMYVAEYDEWDNLRTVDRFTSNFLGRECVLSKSDFYKRFPEILMKSVMLEGPCNRLYVKSIFDALKLRFPVDVSIGEDFLMNLRYYEQCERIVFLDKPYYYYIRQNSDSLSSKYRQNMYLEKSALLDEYSDFLKRNNIMEDCDEGYYYDYITGYAVAMVKNLFVESCELTKGEIKSELCRIVSDDRVLEAFRGDGWCEPEWEWLKNAIINKDIGLIYDKCKKRYDEQDEKFDEVKKMKGKGIINRAIRKTFRELYSLSGTLFWAKSEEYIYENGVMEFIKKGCK